MKCPSTFSCPVEATLDLIGGKYKALICCVSILGVALGINFPISLKRKVLSIKCHRISALYFDNSVGLCYDFISRFQKSKNALFCYILPKKIV